MPHHSQIMGDEKIGKPETIAQGLEQIDYLRLDRHVER